LQTADIPGPATDAVDRALKTQSAASLFLYGFLALAVGLVLVRLVARFFDRSLPRPPPPRPLHPALLIASVFFVPLSAWLAARLLGIGKSGAGMDLRGQIAAESLVTAAFLVFLIAWTARFKQGLPELGVHTRQLGTALLFAVVFYVAFIPGFLGANSIEYGVWAALGKPMPHQAAVDAFAHDPAVRHDLLVLGGIVLFVPCFEELAFRGVIQHFLTHWVGSGAGIVLTAICFTLPHDANRGSVFALGLALSWLRARTGNLLAPLCFHVLHNGFTLAMIASTGGA
jgi:membrane protease YdiL (CAAX protease family)